MNLLWALKQSVLSISIELRPPVCSPPPPPPTRPQVMTETSRLSVAAIFTTTGPHQLITCRNRILTDGPMHIDLPPSKQPNANESFSHLGTGGEKTKHNTTQHKHQRFG